MTHHQSVTPVRNRARPKRIKRGKLEEDIRRGRGKDANLPAGGVVAIEGKVGLEPGVDLI